MKKTKQLSLWIAVALIYLTISSKNLGVLADNDNDKKDDDDKDNENGTSLDPAQTISDTTSSQSFSCSSSSSSGCLFNFTPLSTFTGVIEATAYIPSIEGDSVSSQSTPPYAFLFCDKATNECDYTGQYLKLRNLSISSTFQSGKTYSFTLNALCGTNNIISVYINVIKSSTCVNNNCGNNGTCSAISNNLGQCTCNSSHGAKNCQAALQSISPNDQQTLTIPSMGQSLVKFQFDVSQSSLMTNNELNLILNGVANPSCLIYILDSSSQTNNGQVFSFQNSSFNINNLFSTGSLSSARLLRSLSTTQTPLTSSYNFNLLLFIINKSDQSQDIVLELKVTDASSSSSGKGDKMFLYFIIGMSFLAFIIILSSGIYYFQRRRIIAQQALQANILAALQNNLHSTSGEDPKKQEEDFETFYHLFCQAIPSQPMNQAKLDQILRQSLERKTAVKVCTCSICLSPIEIKNNYRTSMCNHQFHTSCIDAWVKKQRNCPMCRTPHDTEDLEKFMKNGRIVSNFETIKIQGQQIQFEMVDNPAYSLKQAQELQNIPSSILQGSRQQQQQQSYQMGKRVTFCQILTKEQEPQKDKSPFMKNTSPETSPDTQNDFRLSNLMKTAASSTIRGSLSPREKIDSEQFSVFGLSDLSDNSVILSGNSGGKNSFNNNNSYLNNSQQLKLSPPYTFERQQTVQAQYLKSKFNNMSPLQHLMSPMNVQK